MTVVDHDKPDMFRTVFDVIPSLVFVVDDDVRIMEYNAAVADFLLKKRETIIRRRGGEVLHCLHSTDVPEGCGRAPFCTHCIIRNAVAEAFQGTRVIRRRKKIEIIRDGEKLGIYALITASPFCFKDQQLVLLVIEDIREIAELQRLIHICSVCKKIKDEKEAWSRVEVYFKEQWDVDFSHGLCPECHKHTLDKIDKKKKTGKGCGKKGR